MLGAQANGYREGVHAQCQGQYNDFNQVQFSQCVAGPLTKPG